MQHQPQELRIARLMVDDLGHHRADDAGVVAGVGGRAQLVDEQFGPRVARLALEDGGVEVILMREEAEDDRFVDLGGAGNLAGRRAGEAVFRE